MSVRSKRVRLATLHQSPAVKTICIGNAAGFWGDQIDAPRLLCEEARLDYLTLEYLAERTMSILAHQRSRNPNAGYVTHFPTVVESLLPSLKTQPDLRIVTNAGGMNPAACVRRVGEILSAVNLDDVPLAMVTGDDLLPDLDTHLASGETFAHFETDRPLGELRGKVISVNAYLGAVGIVEALSKGARVVITGRVADASLTVGPAVYEFGWAWDQWDHLAAATVAGHLIECGAQATGGMYSGWTDELPLADVGYPIAEISDDGSLSITKAEGTAGSVTTGTVAEQLVYEIGDPAHYLTPDVEADFREVRLEQAEAVRVRVSGPRGRVAPERYKVSLAYEDGYMASGTLVIWGRNARQKAQHCAEMIFQRMRRAGFDLSRTNVECLGSGDSLLGIGPRHENPWEVVLRVSAHDPSRKAVERLSRELAPLVTSGPPGVTGYTGARVIPHRVLAYWPTTISRSCVSPCVSVKSAKEWSS